MFVKSDVNAFGSVWARARAQAAHAGYGVRSITLYTVSMGGIRLVHILLPPEAKRAAHFPDTKTEKGRRCVNPKLLSV